MKSKSLILMLFALSFCLSAFSQSSKINIIAMHQLIDESKSENKLQVKARDKQTVTTANEQANLTLLTKMKNTYRTLQQRYNALGTAINIADIGIYATPMVKQIVSYQLQIIKLVEQKPALALLGYSAEVEFVGKAESLLGYVTGLTLSIGDINQMKASDRKLLFDDVLMQLSQIQELSGNLLNTLTYSSLSSLLRTVNPFRDYIDRDKEIVESIIQNAKYLKQ